MSNHRLFTSLTVADLEQHLTPLADWHPFPAASDRAAWLTWADSPSGSRHAAYLSGRAESLAGLAPARLGGAPFDTKTWPALTAGEFNGVKDSVDTELKSTGAKEAMSAIKTGMSIDLKSPVSVARTVIGVGGSAAAATAAVDKPVQVAPAAADDDDDAWPQGAGIAMNDAVLAEMLGGKPSGNGSSAAGDGAQGEAGLAAAGKDA